MKQTEAAAKKRSLRGYDRAMLIFLGILLALMVVLALLRAAHIALIQGSVTLYLPFIGAVALLGWGASAIARRVTGRIARPVVCALLVLVIMAVALVALSYLSYVAMLTVPQRFTEVRSPSGARRLVVLRSLDSDEARVQQRMDARLAADPEGEQTYTADDFGYVYSAWPIVGELFYRTDADVEGEVVTGYTSQTRLLVKWSDDETEAHFYLQDPADGEGGDCTVRF